MTDNIIISGAALVHPRADIVPDEALFNKHVSKKNRRLATRAAKIGLTACNIALERAGFVKDGEFLKGYMDTYYTPERRGVFICSPNISSDLEEMFPSFHYCESQEMSEKGLKNYYELGAKKIYPLWLIRGLSNLVLGIICITYEMKGSTCNWTDYHSDSRYPLLEGIYSIKENTCDVVIVGAFDSLTSWFQQGESSVCEEFRGIAPAEGGIFLVLERKNRWEERRNTGAGYEISIDMAAQMDTDLSRMVAAYGNCGAATFLMYNFWSTFNNRG